MEDEYALRTLEETGGPKEEFGRIILEKKSSLGERINCSRQRRKVPVKAPKRVTPSVE